MGENVVTIWNAHYKDAQHDMDIQITNNEQEKNPLSFTIDGIPFAGSNLCDFELADPGLYDLAKEKFSLMKWGGYSKHHQEYTYDLQRYSLDIDIPVTVVRNCDNEIIQGILRVGYRFVKHDMKKNQCIIMCDDTRVYRDDLEIYNFALLVDGRTFEGRAKSSYFDTELPELCRCIHPDYKLKCCYTCQWSDYSPYGNDDFGSMLCYRDHKAEYLKVNNKDGWFKHLEMLPFIMKQETSVCVDYEERVHCHGYRGFVL